MIIEANNITKTYQIGDQVVPVLKGISFAIAPGEFVAITGPSGSGKSTLMHILGALDSLTSGSYSLDGQDISKLSEDELADIRMNKIGFVFQSFNLLPRTSVLRNVMLPLIYAKVPRAERARGVAEALKSADMPEDRWDHRSNELSGGQMQRVAIARALVNNPKLIMADEPTGNLDSKTGDIVLKAFQTLNQRDGRTIVLITHERYVAEHASRIIELRDGMIVRDSLNNNNLHKPLLR